MTRLASFVVLALALFVGGCEKPTEDSCRKALDNMRRLMGTDSLTDNNKNEGEVRRCKGGSSKKSVQCAVDATTYAELRACGFSKLPETLPVTPSAATAGSGAAGSAAGMGIDTTGSGGVAVGSAATGSAAGSAMTGSAAGSAMTGSAGDTGSAAGSAK